MVGFGFADNTSAIGTACFCYYSGGASGAPANPVNGFYDVWWQHDGVGPVANLKTRAGWACYVYAQVSHVIVTSYGIVVCFSTYFDYRVQDLHWHPAQPMLPSVQLRLLSLLPLHHVSMGLHSKG